MKKTSVARRYAKALFELLDPANLAQARTSLTAVGGALQQSADLQHVMASPAFSLDDKVGVLTELGRRSGCPPVGQNFLSQLVKTNRVVLLPDIAEAFGVMVDQSKGTQPVEIVSARPLDSSALEQIKTRLRASLKREVDLAVQTDPALLAGLQIKIGSTVYDSSLRNRLNSMKTLLMRE